MLRRYDVASSSAASLASVPDVVKNTLASGMPDSAGELLGQLDHRADEVQRRGVQHLAGLLADGVDDLGHGVAGDRREDAAEEVEVAVAVGVPHVPALAAHELDRLVVVQRQPARRAPRDAAHGAAPPRCSLTVATRVLRSDVGAAVAVERPAVADLGEQVHVEVADDQLGARVASPTSPTNLPSGSTK